MFNLKWLRGKAPATNGPPVVPWFNPGVVCPDGTVMWLSDDDDWSHRDKESHLTAHDSSSTAAQHSEQIHYHYHRFGMGPWLFLGLQVSLAIALLLILSPTPEPPDQETPLDSRTIPKPDYLIGFLY